MADKKVVRVGSRKSELALIQTKYVISCLQKLNPDVQYEIYTMTTVGDRVLNKSLPKIGEKSLFTKDLEDALTTGGVDFVVHSLKDLPTALPLGMAIGAVLEREDPRDALVLNEKHRGKTLATLPKGSIIGTSSLRRSAQLARNYPHLIVCDIRGNLNTRLAKLDAENSKFAGIILAQAGLVRMGWNKRIDQVLEPTEILYAVGQGALAVECRSNDDYILGMLFKLCHLETQCKIIVERSFLKTLGGGCSAPVAVCTNLKRKHDSKSLQLYIEGAVWSLDGKSEIKSTLDCELQFNEKGPTDETDDAVPIKKTRTVEDNNSDNNGNNQTETTKLNPPLSEKKIDLAKFVSVHEEMFQKCPFSKAQNKTKDIKEQGQGDAKPSSVCPSTSFPVGIDFMGNCPYVSTEQKIDASVQVPMKCPIAVHCEPSTSMPHMSADQCPFLKEQAKILDYNENMPQGTETPTLEDNSEHLHCGMYCHGKLERTILDKCEKLGQSLAQELISKGALEVMKCAQNEIHSKA
ncbi:porphobilinogen deaminase [Uranotaenia lowii]|uniref:porphobilinogen deaminase n=1 Tax=Uranotaenia lowii TaxID=190385 RepID=UPI002479FA6D|nr:porphobilinogen deaminase [Uranotaenia lowii]